MFGAYGNARLRVIFNTRNFTKMHEDPVLRCGSGIRRTHFIVIWNRVTSMGRSALFHLNKPSWSGKRGLSMTEHGAALASVARYGHLKVLVIDDEAMSRSMVIRALKSIGIDKIIESTDGSDALVTCLAKNPHIVFCDLQMHPVDGMSFLKKLRAAETKLRCFTPVVFVSAHAEPENMERAKQLGAVAYLTKPVSADQLKDRIDAALGGGFQ
jgi:two-component system, chemotaxis family, chemotaxis protein CheY